MNLTSKPLAFIIFVVMFGGIALSSALGFWQTTSTKIPATYAEGEFAGQANPADIRGSYTFGDIAGAFDVTPELLAQAFQVTTDKPATFAVKNLETMYAESEHEIGTSSVRLFVAFQLGLPFEITAEEIYLPKSAADLLDQSKLTPERIEYLKTFTVDVKPASATDAESAPAPEVASTPAVETSETYLIKGKTTFGELTQLGVPQSDIEKIIGASMPDPAMKIKDYASANGLDFEALKAQLQVEVDKLSK